MTSQATARISNIKKLGLLMAAFLLSTALGISLPAPQASAAACAAPSEALGSASTSVEITTEGEYSVWSRIKAPDTTNNSYFLEVDGECYTVGDADSIAAGEWVWVNYTAGDTAATTRLNLTAGNHDLKFIGKEAGVALDKVMFVQDATCIPTDLGTNCASTSDNAGPAIELTKPTNNEQISGPTTFEATAGDNPGGSSIAKVEFMVDEEVIATDTEAPYSADWDSTTVANGNHNVIARAYDAAGNSNDSSVMITVQNETGGGGGGGGGGNGDGDGEDIENPTAPTGLTAAVNGDGDIQLNWNASTDNVGVTSYKVVRNGTESASVTETSLLDNEVQPGQTYSYQVMAVDAAGNESPLSEAASATTGQPSTPDTQAPSTPAELRGTAANSRQINLTWRGSNDNTGVTAYEVFRLTGTKTGEGTRIASNVTGTSFGDSGLNASTAYTYYIVAKDAAGNRSPESNRITVTTPAPSAAGLPSTGPGDDVAGLTGPGGLKGSINLKVSGGRVVVWINGTKRIFSLDSRGNYNVAGLPRGVYAIKYTLRNYRVSFLWLKVDDGVKTQNVSLRQ